MGVSLAVYLLILPWHSVSKLRWDFSGMLCLWSCDSFLELGLLILWSCDALKVSLLVTNGAIIYCLGFAWDFSNADIDTSLLLICDLIVVDSGDHDGIEG